jgi:transcriptional regulator with XRE-family HTH domain
MFGERLKHYRKLRMMSQEELAECMGFPPNTISKIEHGTRKVTLEEAVRLAEVLRISLLDLAGIAELSSQTEEVKTLVHQCAQKVREAATVLNAATHMADNLERTVSSF